jgi:hypothetical protein
MAIEKSEIKSVKELNESLEVGDSYVVEATAYCPEYPNIPKEIWHVKREKVSKTNFRIIPWD